MNIFTTTEYRQVLENLLAERRRDDTSVSYQELAAAMRVPKSYLSKVMHGRADLSFDQLFLGANYFRLTVDERDYLELLLAWARCGVADRRTVLFEKIEATRKKKLDTQAHLRADVVEPSDSLQEYYLDPVHQIVHAALSIPKYQASLKDLAQDLGMALSRVADAAMGLERLGILERSGAVLQIKRQSMHLPKTSLLYGAWRTQLRLLALQRAQVIAKDDSYGYSVVFSADKSSDQEIKARFFEFLKDIEATVGAAPSERVFQMNFDILPWC